MLLLSTRCHLCSVSTLLESRDSLALSSRVLNLVICEKSDFWHRWWKQTPKQSRAVRLPSATKSKHIKLLQHLHFLSVSNFFFSSQTETHTENKPHTLHIKTPNTHYKTSTRAPTWTVCISVTRVCTFLCVHGITFLNERHRMPEACFLAQMKHLYVPLNDWKQVQW